MYYETVYVDSKKLQQRTLNFHEIVNKAGKIVWSTNTDLYIKKKTYASLWLMLNSRMIMIVTKTEKKIAILLITFNTEFKCFVNMIPKY